MPLNERSNLNRSGKVSEIQERDWESKNVEDLFRKLLVTVEENVQKIL
jgi:hypothetical protein